MTTSTETKIALLNKSVNDNQKTTDESFIRLEKKVDENQVEIIKRMDSFAFESIKDHDNDMKEAYKAIEQAKKDLRAEYGPTVKIVEADTKLVNAGGLKKVNAVDTGVGKAVISIIVLGIIGWVIFYGARLYPAIGGQ